MTTAFNVLFVSALFAPPIAVITGIVVFALGAMTDRTGPRSAADIHETPRAA